MSARYAISMHTHEQLGRIASSVGRCAVNAASLVRLVNADESCSERAAIMEHDGGIDRREADRRALELSLGVKVSIIPSVPDGFLLVPSS